MANPLQGRGREDTAISGWSTWGTLKSSGAVDRDERTIRGSKALNLSCTFNQKLQGRRDTVSREILPSRRLNCQLGVAELAKDVEAVVGVSVQ